jgi:hypothetical protein
MVREIRQSKAMVEAVQFLLASDPRVRCTPYPLYPFIPVPLLLRIPSIAFVLREAGFWVPAWFFE